MPPRIKQSGRRQPAKKSGTRSRTASEDEENRPQQLVGQSKRVARNKSRDTSKLDESMKSMKSVSQEETTPVALQAQQELEIQQAFATITEQILDSAQDATAVTVVMKRTLLLYMRKAPALFQKTLLAFIEQLITLEDDSHVRNIHLLLTRLFHDFVQVNDRQNGIKLIKSVIKYLLDVYHLPKLLLKLQMRCGHMLALTINATAQKTLQGNADESVSQQALDKQSRMFSILDENRHDEQLRIKLEETVIQMLSVTKSTVESQYKGIQIGSFLSNYRDDPIFNQMMKLLIHTKSAAIRKKIIKSFRVPYSTPALAFLGKRLRDSDPTVVELVFEQLTQNGVTICNFPTPEARMLVLTEGFTSVDSVKQKCIEFLKPTVLEYAQKNNIAGLLKLIEAKLAFGNEYFGRMPGLLTLAIFEILEQDVTMAEYLEKVVIKKLRRLAGISETKKHIQAKKVLDEEQDMDEFLLFEVKKEAAQDVDMVSNKGSEHSKQDQDVEQAAGPVTFEEILLLRLAFELNRSTKHQRSQAYLEKLEEIVPEFQDYRLITFALANMDEPDLPFIDPKDETIRPYPKGQVGFTRRAILGEWMKFSLQMNIQDEIIRKNLTTLCFELIGKIEYSYADYEHLLKKQTQLLKGDDSMGSISLIVQACMNDEEDMQGDFPEIDDLIQKQSNIRHSSTDFKQEEENQSVEIIIRNFEKIGTARSLQEYCKPFAMETLTLDFDDVCQVAVTVTKALLGDRVDEFQLKIMEAISDIKETIQEESSADPLAGQRQVSNMVFSQLPMNQSHPESVATISFAKLRARFMKKIEQKVDACQALGSDDTEFDIATFNKTFGQLQIFVQLVEETHLKEKLSYKRALTLCRSLLKHCRLANVHDHNVISICESFIHPAVLNVDDKENILLALECIGLICILDKEVFLNYSDMFKRFLLTEISPDTDDKREKVIAIKSVVDSLIIHGIGEEKLQGFFEIITTNYLTTKDRVLRQVTIEAVCKMLFTKNLCDQNSVERVEAILAQLLFQLFDQKYNKQNSLVKSILKHFLSNFALFSEQRCHMLLNALTKVTYAVLYERYGLDKSAIAVKKGAKKGKKGKVQQKKQKRGVSSSDSESEVSSIDIDYDSDDSKFEEEKIQMRQICKSVDLVQMCRVVMLLLSRKYVNDNTGEGGLKLKTEFSVLFFQRLLRMNRDLFKKTQIVKDVITQVLEAVSLESCDYLDQLKQVEKQWEQTSKLLIQIPNKVAKFQHRLNTRVLEFEEIVEANEQCSNVVNRQKDGDFEMNHSGIKAEKQGDSASLDSDDDDGRDPSFNTVQLQEYWQDYIDTKVVDRGTDDDRELLQLQRVWIELTSKETNLLTSSAKKSILKSPSNFGILGGNHLQSSTSQQKIKQPLTRPKRGGRQAQKPIKQVSGSAIAISRAFGLQSITEETEGIRSASIPDHRKVRIVEKEKKSRSKQTRGAVKSEISEEDEDESESVGASGTEDRHQNEGSDSSSINLVESSYSHSVHKDTVNDNLGRIANNFARKFAKKSKRSLSPSNQSKGADSSSLNLSDRWHQSKGMNTLKLEQPAVLSMRNQLNSADKHSPKSSDQDKHTSVKKVLIRDFDVFSNEKPSQKKGGMLTRRRQKSQSSNLSNSRSYNAAADNVEESEDMYDFMDGTLTKQLKQKQRVGMKEPARRQEIKQETNLDMSKSSDRSKSSMRTRQRRIKQ